MDKSSIIVAPLNSSTSGLIDPENGPLEVKPSLSQPNRKNNQNDPKETKKENENSCIQKLLNNNIKDEILNDKFQEKVINQLPNEISFLSNNLIKKGKENIQSQLDLGSCGHLLYKNSQRRDNIPYSIPFSTADKVICEYAECELKFLSYINYDETFISKSELSTKEYENIISRANEIVFPFWRKVKRINITLILSLLLGFLFSLAAGILLAIYVIFYLSILIFALYFIGGLILILNLRSKIHLELSMAHIALSIYAFSKNEGELFRKGIRMRPGGLAKWIEFIKYEKQKNIPSKKEGKVKVNKDRGM